MDDQITVVITSCGRFELLEKTIRSFFRFSDSKIKEVIIVEDSGLPREAVVQGVTKCFQSIHGLNVPVRLIHNIENLGQLASIDKAYGLVKTDLVFHLEDDWEFYSSGFIKPSIEILRRYPWMHCVWLRSIHDTNGHPVEFVGDLGFSLLRLNYLNAWHGFTFNPGLRRLSDYQLVGPFAGKFDSEAAIGVCYMKLGFRGALLNPEGYVRHIGWGVSTRGLVGRNVS